MSRQNFYKIRKDRQQKEVDAGLIIEFVRSERAWHPRIGGRKLMKLLSVRLKEQGVQIGRDRFFKLMRDHGMLVEKLPPAPYTTNSYHSLPVVLNKIREVELTSTNQVWVADISVLQQRRASCAA